MVTKRDILAGLNEILLRHKAEEEMRKRLQQAMKENSSQRNGDCPKSIWEQWQHFADLFRQHALPNGGEPAVAGETAQAPWFRVIRNLCPRNVAWHLNSGDDLQPILNCHPQVLKQYWDGMNDSKRRYPCPDLWIFSDILPGGSWNCFEEGKFLGNHRNAECFTKHMPTALVGEVHRLSGGGQSRLVRLAIQNRDKDPVIAWVLLLEHSNEQVHRWLLRSELGVTLACYQYGMIEHGSLLYRNMDDPTDFADLGVEWLFSPGLQPTRAGWTHLASGIPIGSNGGYTFLLHRPGAVAP